MPASKYTPKPAIYDCLQYDGNNFTEIAAMDAPVVLEDGVVYFNDQAIMAKVEVPVGYWMMKDHYGVFSILSDEAFHLGFKPGGGP